MARQPRMDTQGASQKWGCGAKVQVIVPADKHTSRDQAKWDPFNKTSTK